ncbi:MAG: HDOD domain-containing protein [Gammaproteobacteria bacterium]|nr:HDOD domain-containing protein [Gammaproteobacteria bacterium]
MDLQLDDLIADVVDLVPLPTAYVKIRELIQSPDSALADVAAVITNDPGLTSRILRMANSAYLGLAAKVDTVARATQVLGLNQVHDLALATSAIGALARMDNPVLDMHMFWRRSIYAAVFSQTLAAHTRSCNPQRIFVCGLLHDVGHLILAARAPKILQELHTLASHSHRGLDVCEREQLGFDYALIGGELLRSWQLPDAIHMPVEFHTSPRAVPEPEHTDATRLVHIAAVVCRAVLSQSAEADPAPEFDPEVLSAVGLDADTLGLLMTETDAKVAEAYQLLLPTSAARPTARVMA